MAKFSKSFIAEAKEEIKKSMYIKKVWTPDESTRMTIEEYAKYIDPLVKDIDGNPTIIAKERKDGGIFLKMAIPLKGGAILEYDLPRNREDDNEFEEDDEIDLSSLTFCREIFANEKHWYATGEVL